MPFNRSYIPNLIPCALLFIKWARLDFCCFQCRCNWSMLLNWENEEIIIYLRTGFFNIPVDNLYADALICSHLKSLGIFENPKYVLVSPDSGGVCFLSFGKKGKKNGTAIMGGYTTICHRGYFPIIFFL